MAFNFENYDSYINESPNQLALQASPITADLEKQTDGVIAQLASTAKHTSAPNITPL